MKHRRGRGGDSSGGESSEDEGIINPEEFNVEEGTEEMPEYDEFFEHSQDLTQVIPRSSISDEFETSKKKKKDKRRAETSSPPVDKRANGFRFREVDLSAVSGRILANMVKMALPNGSDISERLNSDNVEEASSSKKGGIWIFQCSKNINLPAVLARKKISLGCTPTPLGGDDDDLQLTQFAPTDALGENVGKRRYEAVPIHNQIDKQGVMLLLPDSNGLKIAAAPVNGRILIREAVEEISFPKIEVPKLQPRKLPTGIKERHPVYGVDFTNIIQEMNASSTSPKKKKKSCDNNYDADIWKSHNGHHQDNNFQKLNIKQEIGEHKEISGKKKKKKKHKSDYEEEASMNVTDYANSNSYLHEDTEGDNAIHARRSKKSKKRKREEMEDSIDLDRTEILLSKKSKKSKRYE